MNRYAMVMNPDVWTCWPVPTKVPADVGVSFRLSEHMKLGLGTTVYVVWNAKKIIYQPNATVRILVYPTTVADADLKYSDTEYSVMVMV